ncbi:hypothetical protein HMPREF1531_00307 [Propionibacterium sp. oral taxon 192 str. F0372]|nr:hypothetical protein HMPREF1531_00307 [Propionibacterium sp. oral taxon 192 str. F0372]
MSAAPLLSMRGLCKSFGDLEVLQGLDLDLKAGEVLGLVGRNGVGKSTLAALLAGESEFESGELSMEGGPWDPDRVMLIDPEATLDPDLTVVRAMFRHALVEPNIGEMMKKARKVLAESGVALMAADRLGDLTGSEQRMVEVVRMLADPRDVIVIDELSNTLNAREVEDLRFTLNRSIEAGRGVLYVTHRLGEALSLCDRIAVMREGRIVEIFNAKESTVDDLSEAMFGQAVESTPRVVNTTEDALFEVEGLRCDDCKPISFTLHKGEILAVCGARNSGVKQLMAAFTGESPCPADAMRMLGIPMAINGVSDLPRNRIAVLSSSTIPTGDTHAAWNLSMLNEEQEDDESEIEETIHILKTLRFLEEKGNRILKRPVRSTGQRRWLQLQELAAENARMMVLVEPMQGLDASARERFVRIMEAATQRGAGVLLFSGDETEIEALADRALVVRDGAVVIEMQRADLNLEQLKRISLETELASKGPVIRTRKKRRLEEPAEDGVGETSEKAARTAKAEQNSDAKKADKASAEQKDEEAAEQAKAPKAEQAAKTESDNSEKTTAKQEKTPKARPGKAVAKQETKAEQTSAKPGKAVAKQETKAEQSPAKQEESEAKPQQAAAEQPDKRPAEQNDQEAAEVQVVADQDNQTNMEQEKTSKAEQQAQDSVKQDKPSSGQGDQAVVEQVNQAESDEAEAEKTDKASADQQEQPRAGQPEQGGGAWHANPETIIHGPEKSRVHGGHRPKVGAGGAFGAFSTAE